MARPSRSAMYADDATFLWKPILRLLAILLAIVGIGTTAWALISHVEGPVADDGIDSPSYTDYGYDYFYGEFVFLPWQFIALGLSVLWNIANIVTLLVRNRAIHPGANVACDLLLWLGLLFTGGIASLGASNFLYFYAYDDYGYEGASPYGGGTYGNGTQYEYAANGTAVAVTNGRCDGFATCAERDQYVSAVHHKGVIVAVGAAMAFVVLLFHFALFISACRYTHGRRHSNTNRQARAVTAEATEIARKMIADMTGPNGGFVPRNQGQQAGRYEPLQESEATNETMEMRQPQGRSQTGHEYQSVQQGEVEEGAGTHGLYDDGAQRRYPQMGPGMGASTAASTAAVGWGDQRAGDGLKGETHPALRNDAKSISHAT